MIGSEEKFKEGIKKRPAFFFGNNRRKGVIGVVKDIILDVNLSVDLNKVFCHISVSSNNNFQLEIIAKENIKSSFGSKNDFLCCSNVKFLELLSKDFDIEYKSEYHVVLNWRFDSNVIGDMNLDFLFLSGEFMEFAYLNKEFEILISDTTGKYLNQTFYSFPEGIKCLYQSAIDNVIGKPKFEIFCNKEIDGNQYQIFLGYRTDWYPTPCIVSFANQNRTINNGVLVEGIKEGFITGCKEYIGQEIDKCKSYNIVEDKLDNGLILFCSVKGKSFSYRGSFKSCLANEEIKVSSSKLMSSLTLDYLNKNKENANNFLFRFDEKKIGHTMFASKKVK